MKIRLKVIKRDGITEEYLHTKVIGTISKALEAAAQSNIKTAEQLADVVTYFLYHKNNKQSISSSELFSMIKAVLTSTGHDEAAVCLTEYHYQRKIARSRIEVISIDITEMSDIEEAICQSAETLDRAQWDKSIIVADLVTENGIERQMARTIASMVEEKILSMGLKQIPVSLVKQLILNDATAVLRAEQQLTQI
jgi:transcriptional regulator NrdR family protein